MFLKKRVFLIFLLVFYFELNAADPSFLVDPKEAGLEKEEEKVFDAQLIVHYMDKLQKKNNAEKIWTVQDIPSPQGEPFHFLRLKYLKETLVMYHPKILYGDFLYHSLQTLCGDAADCDDRIKKIIADLKRQVVMRYVPLLQNLRKQEKEHPFLTVEEKTQFDRLKNPIDVPLGEEDSNDFKQKLEEQREMASLLFESICKKEKDFLVPSFSEDWNQELMDQLIVQIAQKVDTSVLSSAAAVQTLETTASDGKKRPGGMRRVFSKVGSLMGVPFQYRALQCAGFNLAELGKAATSRLSDAWKQSYTPRKNVKNAVKGVLSQVKNFFLSVMKLRWGFDKYYKGKISRLKREKGEYEGRFGEEEEGRQLRIEKEKRLFSKLDFKNPKNRVLYEKKEWEAAKKLWNDAWKKPSEIGVDKKARLEELKADVVAAKKQYEAKLHAAKQDIQIEEKSKKIAKALEIALGQQKEWSKNLRPAVSDAMREVQLQQWKKKNDRVRNLQKKVQEIEAHIKESIQSLQQHMSAFSEGLWKKRFCEQLNHQFERYQKNRFDDKDITLDFSCLEKTQTLEPVHAEQ